MGPLEGPPCDPGMVGSGFSILNLRGVGGNALRLIRDGAGELRGVRDRAAGGAGKQVTPCLPIWTLFSTHGGF